VIAHEDGKINKLLAQMEHLTDWNEELTRACDDVKKVIEQTQKLIRKGDAKKLHESKEKARKEAEQEAAAERKAAAAAAAAAKGKEASKSNNGAQRNSGKNSSSVAAEKPSSSKTLQRPASGSQASNNSKQKKPDNLERQGASSRSAFPSSDASSTSQISFANVLTNPVVCNTGSAVDEPLIPSIPAVQMAKADAEEFRPSASKTTRPASTVAAEDDAVKDLLLGDRHGVNREEGGSGGLGEEQTPSGADGSLLPQQQAVSKEGSSNRSVPQYELLDLCDSSSDDQDKEHANKRGQAAVPDAHASRDEEDDTPIGSLRNSKGSRLGKPSADDPQKKKLQTANGNGDEGADRVEGSTMADGPCDRGRGSMRKAAANAVLRMKHGKAALNQSPVSPDSTAGNMSGASAVEVAGAAKDSAGETSLSVTTNKSNKRKSPAINEQHSVQSPPAKPVETAKRRRLQEMARKVSPSVSTIIGGGDSNELSSGSDSDPTEGESQESDDDDDNDKDSDDDGDDHEDDQAYKNNHNKCEKRSSGNKRIGDNKKSQPPEHKTTVENKANESSHDEHVSDSDKEASDVEEVDPLAMADAQMIGFFGC